ncbi:MAG TPA: molybdopterin cofactor-binding domain-containing protein, partial [Verrucomicrobiae bacterium]
MPNPTWPAQTKFISHRTERVDATAKVTGRARYSSDIQAEGWLYGMILRSKWPAAKITNIDLEPARQIPGIKAAVLVRGTSLTARYYGEELAAVAGTTKQACLDALKAIQVTAEPLPFVVREDDAKKPDAPKVWENTPNYVAPNPRTRGDVDAAFSQCKAVIEGQYGTPIQVHNPLETHGNTVSWTDEELTAWASTQGISSVRDGLAGALKLEHSKVRVITDYMGGGFGAKFGAGVEGVLAAKLSKEAKAPVRLMLTRFDQNLAVGNRPSSFQKIKLGAAADGTLLAFELDNYGTAGIGAGGDQGGGGGGADIPAPYLYKVPNSRVKQGAVMLNAGAARAFRAPGHPPASLGMECALDDLAVKLGMDPVEIRLKNDPSEIRRREYQVGREKFGWAAKYRAPGSSPGSVKTGIGCAGGAWGWGGPSRDTFGEAQISADGSIE